MQHVVAYMDWVGTVLAVAVVFLANPKTTGYKSLMDLPDGITVNDFTEIVSMLTGTLRGMTTLVKRMESIEQKNNEVFLVLVQLKDLQMEMLKSFRNDSSATNQNMAALTKELSKIGDILVTLAGSA